MIYTFEGTECRIPGCAEPVANTRNLMLCSLHRQRHLTGRMREDGSLNPPPARVINCVECGVEMIANGNLKCCPECRPTRRKKIQKLNYQKIKQQRQKKPTKAQVKRDIKYRMLYMIKVLNKMERDCKRIAKHKTIIDMRKGGATYASIAKEFGVSPERIRQICK